MIHLNFDEKGNLTPHGCIESTPEEFREKFTWNAWRTSVYEKYVQYSTELYELIGEPIQQWLDGSFVTSKERPDAGCVFRENVSKFTPKAFSLLTGFHGMDVSIFNDPAQSEYASKAPERVYPINIFQR